MTQQHTPGPWTAEKAVDDAGFETGKIWIIMKGAPCGYDFDRWEDAVLAAAAPDLLAALQALVETCTLRSLRGYDHTPSMRDQQDAISDAQAAIARATGGAA